MVSFVLISTCLIDAWPPIGDRIHTVIRAMPGRVHMRSWICDVTALVREVLAAKVSNIPTRSPLSNRQIRMACVARPTTEANRIGKIVGLCDCQSCIHKSSLLMAIRM